MQLLDELSMIYMVCTTFYAVFSFNQSRSVTKIIFVFVVSLAAFITGYYHYLKDPVFHQNTFALLAAIVIFTSIYDMEKLLRPSRRVNNSLSSRSLKNHSRVPIDANEQTRIDKRDAKILKDMWVMVICGLSSVAIGFLVWNLDTIFCTKLRHWRREMGLPWGILLEGHGWW